MKSTIPVSGHYGVASIPDELGKPASVLADAGYVNADAFDRLHQEGVEIYCSGIARTPTTSATKTFGRRRQAGAR